MSGFQTQAFYNPAPAVEGDFASTNMRTTALAAAGALVCGALGVIVGRFAWLTSAQVDSDNAPAVVNTFGTGPVAGFIHREQQGLIEVYLQESTMLVPAGFPITVYNEGDFWVRNAGVTPAQVGQKVYANYADGKATAAPTGTPNGATTSVGSIAAATSGFVGSIVGNVLAVTAVNAGTIYPGTTISGIDVATGTKIVSQLSGTPGGVGTYAVSIPDQSVDPGTVIAGTYGVFTAGGVIAGVFGVGDTLTGAGITAVTTICQQITDPAGGAGTYAVDVNTVVAAAAITAATNVETKWTVRSFAQPGELMKISAWPQG
ncbi:gp53 minor capsid family protein [Mesorhizobium sp. P5_C1]